VPRKSKNGKEFQNGTRDADGNPISPVNGQPTPKHRPITPENAREYQKKAMESIREKRSIAKAFKERLTMEFTDDKGNKMSGAEIIAMSIFKGANNGNARMVEIALGLLGEKPAETVNVNMPDPTVMEEIRRRMEQTNA
jgi:hypothetical protein